MRVFNIGPSPGAFATLLIAPDTAVEVLTVERFSGIRGRCAVRLFDSDSITHGILVERFPDPSPRQAAMAGIAAVRNFLDLEIVQRPQGHAYPRLELAYAVIKEWSDALEYCKDAP